MLLSIDIVFGRAIGPPAAAAGEPDDGRQDISVFPLATPIIAGPGAITAVVVQATEAGNRHLRAWIARDARARLVVREFRLVKVELEPGSRRFLVKQAHQSLVCELDLKGFAAELAVISGRASAVHLVNQLIALHGRKPAQWLPPFYQRVAGEGARTHVPSE